MTDFHFLRPAWLLALPPLLLLIIWLARNRLRSRSWQAVCDPELLPHLLLGRSVRRANWPLWLLLAGLLLTVVALAGPVWQQRPLPLFRQQSALVILFDLSRSMQADDLQPSRFLRARLKIEDLLRQRREGQTALIVFAADAFTVTPLTEDRHTIEALLKSLDPGIMPEQGSAPDRAIERGLDLMQQAGLTSGRLLLVTDEDRPQLAMDAAEALAEQGFELAVLGVGSAAGAPVPLAGGGFLKNSQGDLVVPKLDTSGLRMLASAGGGSYRTISVDDSDLRTLLNGREEHQLDSGEQTGHPAAAAGDRWREEGIWLLWPLTLLAALAFRRGWLLVVVLVMIMPSPVQAFDWADLWQTADQQAARSYAQGDFPQAAQQFRDSRWKAAALYRAGEFDAAASQLENPQTADDWYNRGNALARAGGLAEALKSYRAALQAEPSHVDARHNLELVEQALRQQQQEAPENPDGQKKNRRSGEQGDQSGIPKSSPGAPDMQSRETSRQSQSDGGAGEKQEEKSDEQSSVAEDDQQPSSQPEDAAKGKAGEEDSEPMEGDARVMADQPETNAETAEQRESQLLLQQIPDDPGGLMRRKFLYQYRQRGQQRQSDRSW